MQAYHKKIFVFSVLILVLIILISGCSKHAIIDEEMKYSILFEEEKRDILIGVKKFSDVRSKEEREGLIDVLKKKKILSLATKDSDFKEKVDRGVTHRVKTRLEEEGIRSIVLHDKSFIQSKGHKYVLEGEIRHFWAVLRLPNTTFVPYLGVAATVITKDEFNVIVEIEATLRDVENNKVLFSEVFDASEDLQLSTGILNFNRFFKRGLNYRIKLLDKALDNICEQIVEKVELAIGEEMMLQK